MKLMSIAIQNFKGIQTGNFVFPFNQRIMGVIGPGDSCKTTLLKAIEWSIWPTWNLSATDMAFYNGNTSNPTVTNKFPGKE